MIRISDPSPTLDSRHPRIGYASLLLDIPGAVLAATSETDDEPASNLRNPATYLRWRATSSATQNLDIDAGSAVTVGYWAIASHNLGTVGATARLYYSDNAMSWTAAATGLAPADDRVQIDEVAPTSHRYWRLAITGASAAPAIGVLYVGEILQVPTRVSVGHAPITLARKTQVVGGTSESGEFLGRRALRDAYQTQAAFGHLTLTWVNAHWKPFSQATRLRGFFWARRPVRDADETAYCWTTDDPAASIAMANGMLQAQVSMQGML